MCLLQVNPPVTLKKFVPLCSDKVLSLTEHEEVQLEEDLDDVILFNLQILAEVIYPNEKVLAVFLRWCIIREFLLHIVNYMYM